MTYTDLGQIRQIVTNSSKFRLIWQVHVNQTELQFGLVLPGIDDLHRFGANLTNSGKFTQIQGRTIGTNSGKFAPDGKVIWANA